MKFKLIVALVTDDLTDTVIEAARKSGATGCTVITSARGEGLKPSKTFLGLTLEGLRDVVLLLVEQHLSHATGVAEQINEETDRRRGLLISNLTAMR